MVYSSCETAAKAFGYCSAISWSIFSIPLFSDWQLYSTHWVEKECSHSAIHEAWVQQIVALRHYYVEQYNSLDFEA